MIAAPQVEEPEVEEPEVEEPEVEQLVDLVAPAEQIRRPSPIRMDGLFANVLLEPTGLQRRRRTVSAILSLIVQCVLLGAILIIPLMFTEALPTQQLLTFLVAPPPPPPPPPAAAGAAAKVLKALETNIMDGQLRTPTKIPQRVQIISEEEAPPTVSGGVVGGVPGGIPGGQLGGVIGGIITSTSNLASIPKMSTPVVLPRRVRISQGVIKGMLIQKIEPNYPPIARSARIQGDVVLTAIISRSGDIENLALVSGHPMLVPAAMEAVKQWHYRPYLLNGEPTEVETTITVTFRIAG